MTAQLPDAAPSNWVDRHAPPAMQPWLKLGRFDRPAGIWLLMLPGWQGAALAAATVGVLPDPWLLAKILVGAALMRAAGCAFNDVVDRDIDAKVARTAMRPVASGQISLKQAYPFMKRITWWPQAWLGLTFNWGALLAYAAATGRIDLPAVLLYASGIFWTLGYDTIYAIQDLEDDALAGVKSSTRRLGAGVQKGVLAFYVLCFALALATAWFAKLGPLFLPLAALYGMHLSRQAARTDIHNGPLALALFKSNSLAGLLLFLALAAGMWKGTGAGL